MTPRGSTSHLLVGIFVLCVGIHFYCSLVGWNNTLDDIHGFRQTQTAISTFYTIKDGFTFKYIIPVLGAPWSLPFEFPIYQWIVATLVLLFKTPLDQTGRFVTLVFFYLSFFPLYALLGYLVKNSGHRLIILSFVLLNPIYLFWSRTFMLESTALFLNLSFLWGTAKSLEHQRPKYIISALLAGVLASLTKLPTFVAFCFPASIIFLWFWWKEKLSRFAPKILLKYGGYGVLLVGIPLLCELRWIQFSDYQKSLNPIAAEYLTSKVLGFWIFGTSQQRFSLETWQTIFERPLVLNMLGQLSIGKIRIFNLVLLVGFFLLLNPRRRKEILLSFACFLFGPALFTNLYYVHDYYFNANSVFLAIFLGLVIISLLEMPAGKLLHLTKIVFFVLLLLLSLHQYTRVYYGPQKTNHVWRKNIAEIIKANTSEKDILLIYGQDAWSPVIPYYSERKALMDCADLSMTNVHVQKSLEALGDLKITVMVVFGPRSRAFLEERVNYLPLTQIFQITTDNKGATVVNRMAVQR